MVEGHLSQVVKLSEQLGYPVTFEDLRHRWIKLRLNSEHALLVYEENENILGWIHLERITTLVEVERAKINAIVVDENSRGNGVGKALIASAEKWAKTNHLHTIFLSCNILRERTHDFYTREGFVKKKTSHFFEKKI